MKTFLGFTTGLFLGLIGGIAYSTVIVLASPSIREFVNRQAEELEELEKLNRA